jgi:hypothetical protein
MKLSPRFPTENPNKLSERADWSAARVRLPIGTQQ